MKVEFTHKFIKIYKKRFSSNINLRKRFDQKLRRFVEDPNDKILAVHSLSGKLKGYRAFSVTGDIRVIYYINKGIAYFVDIGTHNQVYGG